MLTGQLLGQDCPKRPLLRPRAMTSWGHLVLGHDIPQTFKKKQQNKRKQKHQHQSDCGNDFHCDGLQNCPVRDKVCNYCQKPNHFVSQCFTAKRNDQQTNRDGRKQKFVAA